MDDDDLKGLPLEEQWTHSKWNARQNAYKEVATLFDAAAPDDRVFLTWEPRLKSAGTDSNVIALEWGLKCIAAFGRNADIAQVDAVRAALLPAMAEKAFSAAKPSVKTTFQACCQDLVEGSKSPGAVIDELVPSLGVKSPKAVTASIVNFRELFVSFGRILPPKAVLAALQALFGHNDKNIRAEASNLAVTLVQVIGKPAVEAALTSIKPLQLKELQPKFDAAEPIRPTRVPRIMQAQEEVAGGAGSEVFSENEEPAELDPFDMAEAVDLQRKVPDISDPVASVKWKERKEALESVEELFNGVVRIAPGDFGPLVNQLSRVIQKDANLMCVTSAMNTAKMLASGLRSNFSYASSLLPPIVERFKEKKASVLESATNAAHAIFVAVGMESVLPVICTALKHKTPQARIETSKFVLKILCEAPNPPNSADLKALSEPVVKNMTDTQEPVRAEAAKILAALVKLTGKAMNPILAQLDDMRKQKVTDAAEHVQIKAKVVSGTTRAAQAGGDKVQVKTAAKPAPRPTATRSSLAASRPSAAARASPRTATGAAAPTAQTAPRSPIRSRDPPAADEWTTPQKSHMRPLNSTDFTPAKQSQVMRRRLGSPEKETSGGSSAPLRAQSPLRAGRPQLDYPQDNESRHSPKQSPLATIENDMLRREKMLAVKEREMIQKQLDQERVLRESAERQVHLLREEVDRLKRELNRNSANNSFDGSNGSVDGLNNRMSSMSLKDDSFERFSSRPITLGTPRTSSKPHVEEEPRRANAQGERSRENWRRAAEVTSELKKRIEEMKRTRNLSGQSEI